MVKKENLKQLLELLNFEANGDIYYKGYESTDKKLVVDFKQQKILYRELGITVGRETTDNFGEPENFVVLECVDHLLSCGYEPRHLELEPAWKLGHTTKGGYADIWIRTFKDNGFDGADKDSLLIIECKTPGDEYNGAWQDTLYDGAQLFSYFQQEKSTKFLCLYTMAIINGVVHSNYKLINVQDNEELLATDDKLLSYNKATNNKQLFKVWHDTYHSEYATLGLFQEVDKNSNGAKRYKIGKEHYTINDLQSVGPDSIQKKYNEFATILRQHNVGAMENAFDKLVNLFLAKIVDETNNPNDLHFYWKGSAYDDDYQLQDRLQRLYRDGMKRFLGEDVTYIENSEIDKAFRRFKNDPDATKKTIKEYFRALKFFSDNDFSFISVHNKKLFEQNAVILRKIVKMLEDMRLKSQGDDEQNQLLGNLFEGFLTKGVKQSEGQFFTPIPIVRFIVSSLPIELIIKNGIGISNNNDDNNYEIPSAIDYACGAGHFLTEFAARIKPYVEIYHPDIPIAEYYKQIFGIEKEYRLSKVSKVSAFMYGHDETNIIYADALAATPEVKDKSFSVLIANPPYSVKGFLDTLSEEQRHHYSLYNDNLNIDKNNSIETFFIERAAQLLKAGGVAGIILPLSVLSNSGIYAHAREIILKNFDIIALVEPGGNTFGKTNTKTVIMFMRRKETNTPDSDHYLNRVSAWFSDHDNAEEVYDDRELLEKYCAYQHYDFADYNEFLKGSISESLASTDNFEEYHESFFGNGRNATKGVCEEAKSSRAKYRSRINTKQYKRLPTEQKAEYDGKAFYNFAHAIEKEKVYYFLLANDNPQQVVIVKSPASNTENKKFLGYEWGEGKGREGLHCLNATKTTVTDDEENESDDDTLHQISGIENIQTPLFNPHDLDDDNKINTIIRKNFLREEFVIPDELSPFISCANLTDMISFSGTSFKKDIATNNLLKIEYKSRFDVTSLKKIGNIIGGLWTGSMPPLKTINVIRNTNFDLEGHLSYENVAKIAVEEAQFVKRDLKEGDIVIEKSGGSATQAVGRVVYIDKDLEDFSFSNFTARLRLTSDKFLPKYVYLFLNNFWLIGGTRSMQNGSSGLANLNMNSYMLTKIPNAPKDIQEKIVEECDAEERTYSESKASIELLTSNKMAIVKSITSPQSKKIKDLCTTINPSRTGISNESDDTLVSFIEMSSLGQGIIEQKVDKKLGELRKGGYTYFAENDILIAKITPCMENGKCAIARGLTNGIGMGSTEFHVFRLNKRKILPEYLFALLNQDSVRHDAAEHFTGASGHRRVPVDFYENIEIPMIPLGQQQAIVKQLSSYDEEIQSLKSRMAQCATNKQAILDKYLK